MSKSLTAVKMKKPNIHFKELSFFLKVLEAKVRFNPDINEGLPIQMRKLEELFVELNHPLNGKQINTLFLEQFHAGQSFKLNKLLEWVRENFSKLHKRKSRLMDGSIEASPIRPLQINTISADSPSGAISPIM